MKGRGKRGKSQEKNERGRRKREKKKRKGELMGGKGNIAKWWGKFSRRGEGYFFKKFEEFE